jgi:cytochrome c oxidase subunit 3
MTRHSASLPWPQVDADTRSAQRDDVVQLGVWMFLATVVMLFAAFTSAYIVRRSASDWTPIELPWILWVNTAVLVASSLALEGGRFASRQGKIVSARHGLSAAAGLGLLFLAGQVTAWRELAARGVYLPTSPHSSFVYILTGVHGVHVAAGLVLLIYTATRMWNVSARLDREAATARLIAASATFWHFLAVLWLYVFALVTVF